MKYLSYFKHIATSKPLKSIYFFYYRFLNTRIFINVTTIGDINSIINTKINSMFFTGYNFHFLFSEMMLSNLVVV